MTYLGTATADITPAKPVELSGFAGRVGPHTEVRAPLHAQAFAFGNDAGHTTALLVCADLLWWGPDLYETVAERIAQQHGIDKRAIVLHASHTHCAPTPGASFSPFIGKADDDYLASVADAVVEAAGEAIKDLAPVTIARGSAECTFGMNRRLLHDGGVGGPNPQGDKDSEVSVIRFADNNGGTKAVLVHYTCHPVTSDANKVSPDYPGAMRDQLGAALGDDVVIGFLQGCCGDQDPAFDAGAFRRGGDEDIAELGGQLTDAARKALDDLTEVAGGEVSVRTTLAPLPLDTPTREELANGVDDPGIWGDWSRTLLAQPDRIVDELPLRLTMLRIADGLALLGFDAEVTVEYGHHVKRRSAGTVLPIPYTNGMIGYVVTAEQLEQGGYEPNDSYPYVYRSGRWKPAVEATFKQAIDGVI